MRALITGASGFVGRHLAARLTAEGWAVGLVYRHASDRTNLLNVGHGARQDFAALLSAFEPDVVFHMAGQLVGNARELYFSNAVLATNLLLAVEARTKPPRVVLAGSAAEYGPVGVESMPVSEDHECAPVTDYGISKYAQTLCGLARARNGMPVLIARLFNPIGQGMPSSLALPSFAAQVASGVDGTIDVGNLDVERDFIDVREAVRLMVALSDVPANYGRVFNICSGNGYGLRSLVEDLIRTSGRSLKIVTDLSRVRANDVSRFVGSTSRLREAGLSPAPPNFPHLLDELLTDAGLRVRSARA